jgi:outer membrane murein-binding lipoprotein Lpp
MHNKTRLVSVGLLALLVASLMVTGCASFEEKVERADGVIDNLE